MTAVENVRGREISLTHGGFAGTEGAVQTGDQVNAEQIWATL